MSYFCDVQLDNPSGNFKPGQMVTGRIQLTLHERALIKAFALKFSGYASVRWEKPQKPKKQQKHQNAIDSNGQEIVVLKKPLEYYVNREDYLSTTNYLIGSEAALPNIIAPGAYHYNFSVRLPDVCPCNVETPLGYIRYEMEVFLLHPDRKEICYSRNVQIMKSFDLRLDANLLEPANIDRIEKIKKTKFWQHPLQLHINTPQTGYIPGERISVYIKLLNNGNVVLTDLVYKLNMICAYTGFIKKPRKTQSTVYKNNLLTTVHSLFGQNKGIVEHLESLQVPTTTPNLHSSACKCMQVTYEIEVIVRTRNPKREISAEIPIVVGNISLHDRHPRELDITPATTATGIASSIAAVSRSMDDLSNGSGAGDVGINAGIAQSFSATAPPPETPSPMTDTAVLSASMGSLAAITSLREADHLNAASNMDKTNFKPKYLYYNEDGKIQVEEVTSTSEEKKEKL